MSHVAVQASKTPVSKIMEVMVMNFHAAVVISFHPVV